MLDVRMLNKLLMLASEKGKDACIPLLVQYGADVNTVYHATDKSPLIMAVENGHDNAVKYGCLSFCYMWVERLFCCPFFVHVNIMNMYYNVWNMGKLLPVLLF